MDTRDMPPHRMRFLMDGRELEICMDPWLVKDFGGPKLVLHNVQEALRTFYQEEIRRDRDHLLEHSLAMNEILGYIFHACGHTHATEVEKLIVQCRERVRRNRR